MNKKDIIQLEKLPRHIAIIMDGNGRWAKERGQERTFGHQNGVTAVRETIEAAAELGIKYLTLYAFSTENWNRPQNEINALMQLLVDTINAEIDTLNKNNISLKAIGDLALLHTETLRELQDAIDITASNTGTDLILALSYSSRWEITHAVKQIAKDVFEKKLSWENITQDSVSSNLSTSNFPDPELLIRTSGEYRLSNFLLWQLAYSELYFTPVLWPDFRKDNLYEAIIDFQKRERRFGLTSEQVR